MFLIYIVNILTLDRAFVGSLFASNALLSLGRGVWHGLLPWVNLMRGDTYPYKASSPAAGGEPHIVATQAPLPARKIRVSTNLTRASMLSPRELNLRNMRPRLTNPLTVHHLHNLCELLALFIERQHEHVLVLVWAAMMVCRHRAVQPCPAFFG